MNRLKLGEIDLVIGRMGDHEQMAGVTFTRLYREAVALVVRAGHPLIDEPVLANIVELADCLPAAGIGYSSAGGPLHDRKRHWNPATPYRDRVRRIWPGLCSPKRCGLDHLGRRCRQRNCRWRSRPLAVQHGNDAGTDRHHDTRRWRTAPVRPLVSRRDPPLHRRCRQLSRINLGSVRPRRRAP